MIPIWNDVNDRAAIERLLGKLRLDVRALLLDGGELQRENESVRKILVDVATRGDAALIDLIHRFDDLNFDPKRLRVTRDEMRDAASRVSKELIDAIRRSIAQVREYQTKILPTEISYEARPGVALGLRHTPLDSAGIYVPGGKASYPSSLIMLAVPAQVAGVKRIVVCSPAGKYGDNDLVYAAAHELGIEEFYRVGGVGAIGALACGTESIKPVDKILGPGNTYVQLAKRLVSGAVGVDGFLGPSEILVVADETCVPEYVAADLLAQAEHDPGRCILLTRSADVAKRVVAAIESQLKERGRSAAIEKALANDSAIILCDSDQRIAALANQFAAEHVNLQVKDANAWLERIRHAGAIFVGAHAPVAAGDYVAGPSHCLPTNTTARFGGGVSVYEFMKRTGIAQYDAAGLAEDAKSIIALANAEGLDAHAASVHVRLKS
jgi:histidinol dehydrogenase